MWTTPEKLRVSYPVSPLLIFRASKTVKILSEEEEKKLGGALKVTLHSILPYGKNARLLFKYVFKGS